jgi:hypothetical protein
MKLLISAILLIASNTINAQMHHDHGAKKDTIKHIKKSMPAKHDHSKMDTSKPMEKMDMPEHESHFMNSAYSLSLPMSRNGSGTSWHPDNSPMYMLMKHDKKGMWMFHGSIFLRYNTQELLKKNDRAASKFDAPNWFMAMYNRKVGKNGLFNFTAMLSLDPLTVGKSGYPLLFQTGESYNGKPLIDRQHPHDLFSGLSIAYTHRINKDVDIYGYFGYPGEPALGAPAFMHRISTMNNPDAPLGHHWQDATHIVFGVGTVGLRLGKFKLETSRFTGREPDEDRYNFDKMKFDSYSYRLSYNPSPSWAFQFSQGYIKSPEELNPTENIWRYSASALYASKVKNETYHTIAAVWGFNDAGSHHKEHSALLEATQQFRKQAVYGKYEFVQKSTDELGLQTLFADQSYGINALTIGTNRKLFAVAKLDALLGVQTTLNFIPKDLQKVYGSFPVAGEVYIQIRPGLFR